MVKIVVKFDGFYRMPYAIYIIYRYNLGIFLLIVVGFFSFKLGFPRIGKPSMLGLGPHESGRFQQMNLSPVPCVGKDARTFPCQSLFWHLFLWNHQISNKNDQTTINDNQSYVLNSCLFLSVWLMSFLVLHWHRWWSLWLWKSCRGWIAGFRGRRISTLGHWSFAASEAPYVDEF